VSRWGCKRLHSNLFGHPIQAVANTKESDFMNMLKANLVLVSGMALALAGCGENEAAEPVAAPADQVAAAPQEFDPASREFTLSADAQKRREGFDSAAFTTEYDGYRAAAAAPQTGDAAAQTAKVNAQGLPERGEMNWEYLDRNADGKLSVAEYAIWAVPLNPDAPKANDETKPYVTAEQANKAADSFFYYDLNGDTYLSQREFTSARRGEDFG